MAHESRVTRLDIQALRAFAVGIVVAYHLAPHRLTGGFVGVDVFFAISGFLITSHLVENPPRSLRDLLHFWGRRVRRLLPASLTVLLATCIGAYLWIDESQWQQTIDQVHSAALYYVNWTLAAQAVDYLHAGDAATAVQHYWSLSVEEQFYLVWPILLLILGWLTRHSRHFRRYAIAGISAVVAASLVYSIHETASNPAAAYFVTGTRLWELGLGGVLALLVAQRATSHDAGTPRLRTVVAYLGWLTMIGTAVTFSSSTPFPSGWAAVPLLGALLVISANADLRWYRIRAVTWIGDRSYSIYLWHWVLIVILPSALAHSTRSRIDDLTILVLTVALAWATTRWIEDPVRSGRFWRRLFPTYALGAVAMAAVIAATTLWAKDLAIRQNQESTRVAAVMRSSAPCLGAGYLDPRHHCSAADVPEPPIPAPADAARDRSDAFLRQPSTHRICPAQPPHYPLTICEFGDRSSAVEVALVGNSHATQWLPALERIARSQHFRITLIAANACPGTTPTLGRNRSCAAWTSAAEAELARRRPSLVIASVLSAATYPPAAFAPVYERFLDALTRTSRSVLVLRDPPSEAGVTGIVHGQAPECFRAPSDAPSACSLSRREPYPDPFYALAQANSRSGIVTADLTNYVCAPTRCDAVVGGVVVRYDNSHFTATFATTLAPYLAPYVRAALRR